MPIGKVNRADNDHGQFYYLKKIPGIVDNTVYYWDGEILVILSRGGNIAPRGKTDVHPEE